ncbi:MAG: putative ribosomal small subunit methyltransferase [Actinomycetota bacterium]
MSPAPHSPGQSPADPALLAALSTIRDRGPIGEASLESAIDHADQYVAVLPPDATELADLGSGGGLPGLVIAVRRPDLRITLVERRATRADLLRRAVSSLGLSGRVTVVAADASQVAADRPREFDVVTARSFAAPPITARWAGELLKDGGRLIVSEPPIDDPSRWPAPLLESCGLVDEGRSAGVRTFRRI